MWVRVRFKEFIELFFPRICAVCHNALVTSESGICLECLYNMPFTNYHLMPHNPLEQRILGRTIIDHGAALFYYEKGNPYHQLIYSLKYKHQQDIGICLGQFAAHQLLESPFFNEIDYLVPVPLHPNKLKIRGYNQSSIIAQGIKDVLKTPIEEETLYRALENPTQTHKNSYERWKNSSNIFALKPTDTFKDKTVLLIDDVFTTGSTIAACANTIAKQHPKKIMFYTLACV